MESIPLTAAYSTSRVSSRGRMFLFTKSKTSLSVKDIFHSESTWLMSKSRFWPLTLTWSLPVSALPSTSTSGTLFSTYSSAEIIISLGFTRLGST